MIRNFHPRRVADLSQLDKDFDRIAALELAAAGGLTRPEQWLLAHAPSGPGLAVDLGGGIGRFARALSARGLSVIALDHSAGMMAAMRSRAPRLPGVRADVTELPLRPNAFRCVASIAVLHHLSDPAAALRAWSELLAPGGVLLVQDVLERKGLSGAATNVLAILAAAPNRAATLLSPHRRALRAAYNAHGAGERYLTAADARALTRDARLAGAEVREHLGWRYSLVWRKSSVVR